MIRSLLSVAALPIAALACAACTQQRPEAALPPATAGVCTKDGLESLIGKPRSDAVAAEAMRLSGAKALRWIEPGMAVTMDYREDRLNLRLNPQGGIESVGCG